MSYPKQLLRLQPTRGVVYDVADHEVGPDFWTFAENVQFRDGFATRTLGLDSIYEDEISTINPGQIFHAVNAADFGDGNNWWILFEQDGSAWAIQNTIINQIDDAQLSIFEEPWQFSSTFLNNIPMFANSKNAPFYWPGSGNIQFLPGWPVGEVPRYIASLKFHAFAFGMINSMDGGENLVRWSAATEPNSIPSTWIPGADNDAGFIELSDSPGIILCALPLRDSLFFYKKSSIYQARYVAGQNVFSFRKLDSARGALSPRAVCDIGEAHCVVSDGDIFLTDGTTRKSIGEGRVRDFLFDNIDDTNFYNLYCVYNRTRDEVEIGFPEVGQRFCTRALTYDLSRGAWGFRTLSSLEGMQASTFATIGFVRDEEVPNVWANRPEPWAEAQGTWSAGTVSDAKESLVTITEKELVQNDLNIPYVTNAKIGKSGIDFGEPERVKFVKRIHVRTRDPYIKIFVRVGGQFEPNGPITWSQEVELNNPQQIANLFATGRYIAVECRTNDAALWKITGVDIEAEVRGYH